MIKNYYYIIISFLNLLIITSCKSDYQKEEQHLGPVYFRKVADYFWFKPGSYWIYENNRTGEFDTCILVNIVRDTIIYFSETPNFKRWYTRERIDFDMYSNHRNGIINYVTTNPCMDCRDFDSTFSINRDYVTNTFYVPWDFYKNLSSYYSILQVGDSIYNDVYKFDYENDASLPYWDDTKLLWGTQNGAARYSSYYWARNVGLIQIKYMTIKPSGLDSAFWVLKSKNIIKQ
jgi:hypothetical protein